MKNAKTTILAGLICLGFTSCLDSLDIKPAQDLDENTALSSDKAVRSALIGAYDALAIGTFLGGNAQRDAELLAANGEITFTGTFDGPDQIYNKKTLAINGDVATRWARGYNSINAANNVLSALDVVEDIDNARDHTQGAALFIRGAAYFELVKLFAKPYAAGNQPINPGVPLVLEPTRSISESSFVSRASIQAVYDQIVSDLTMAASLLPDGKSNNYATKSAAQAMLSRVYLQMEDYPKARDAANEVITSRIYFLEVDYASCFNGQSSAEDIFDFAISSQDGTNSLQTYYAAGVYGGRGDIEILPAHLQKYEANDKRLALYYTDPSTGDTRTGKWREQYGNVKIIRLAEMYLTRAESNLRAGTTIGGTPLEDTNRIRARAGLPLLTSVALNDILKERELEFAHEGHKLQDYKRTKRSIVEGLTTYLFDDDLLVLPIPQRELNVNPNLTQNPGYKPL